MFDLSALDPELAREIVLSVQWGGGLLVVGFFIWIAGGNIASILTALAMFLPWNKKGRSDGG